MLYVYGGLMPLRILEEIRFWKTQEKEHTLVIRELVPTLEPQFALLMQQWESVFAQTEAASGQLIEAVIRLGAPISPLLSAQIHELLYFSIRQSNEFVSQLFAIMEQSQPVKSNPVVKTVVMHIIRESEYFIGVLHAASAAGSMNEYERPRETAAGENAPELTPEADEKAYIHRLSSDEELTATQEGTWSSDIRPTTPALKPVPIGGHQLPSLPYAYNALEPHIDAETMRLHHDKHHKSYVDGLNKAETMLAKARESGDFALVKHWEREAAFNGAGHYLHTIFWNVMKPGGGGPASGAIAAEIKKSFGSFEAFKKHYSAAADKVEGGGWAILVWSPRSHRLEILQAEKHQNLSQWDVIPLLVLDVWEHAYYLKYKNERSKYIEAWWNTVNWDHVNERFSAARMLRWLPY
ncbi:MULTISPECIES: Fe-Mn family superoxide dismutase [unclassified Paenibacillus]|uniref:Fe-Mn family superoxide dismutase n=1 Tax=unclassified Paenibacillus TaxID=185978 RepID=UPI001AE9E882|nr:MULTISPECIES: Fe-Mn family superoxide dismutase [unclassified Paenibacillus]MBP1157530.1 Fe-Mn family superoxide dismutase [Paenibacillus sp. PvP091]MBP1171733.1 Fe-Mn family superoxide dismutase [Paenibacillus sp. PvR098]MBP2438114.1 Fe-Mn family superoxide dismutase [Paenibacillus sp. PvP052]